MSNKEIYTKKIEADIATIEGTFNTWRVNAKNAISDERIDYIKQVGEFELMFDALRFKLNELIDAGDELWVKMQDGIDSALIELQAAIEISAGKFRNSSHITKD